jgi:hypothetical protein
MCPQLVGSLVGLTPTLGAHWDAVVALFGLSSTAQPSSAGRRPRNPSQPSAPPQPPRSHSPSRGVSGRSYPPRPSSPARSLPGSSEDHDHASSHPVPYTVDVGENWVLLPANRLAVRTPTLQFYPRDPADRLVSWYYTVLISDGVQPNTVYLTFDDSVWREAPDLGACIPQLRPHPSASSPTYFELHVSGGFSTPHGSIWAGSDFP